MSRSNITDDLFGYTCIRRIEFITDLSDGVCVLTLELSRDDYGTNVIHVKFEGVTGLSIQKIGGGISQFLLLIVEDISEQGLDRINYRVYEAERDSISFMCRSITLKSMGVKKMTHEAA